MSEGAYLRSATLLSDDGILAGGTVLNSSVYPVRREGVIIDSTDGGIVGPKFTETLKRRPSILSPPWMPATCVRPEGADYSYA